MSGLIGYTGALSINKVIVLGNTGIGKTKMFKYICYEEDVDDIVFQQVSINLHKICLIS